MSIVFKDRMWFMGGWYNGRLEGHSASNQVWSTTDGVKWDQATDNAGWTPRIASALVVFQGKMWLLGGTENYYFGDDISRERVEAGRGTEQDLELLGDVPGLVEGSTICAFADAAMWPVQGFMHHFRGDFEQHVREGRCPFPDSFEL